MSDIYVKWEKENATAIITISNPPVNVIDCYIRSELRRCLYEVRDDNEVITVILTATGKAFMAGADINGFPAMVRKKGVAYDFLYEAYDVWYLLESLEKPTIAVLNGLAMGAGCEMALCCDLRIASEKVKIGLPEIKLGLFPGGGGTQRMTRVIGKAKTKEMIFTGEPITAGEAYELGFLNYVVPVGEELNKAKEIAEKINKFSLISLSQAKKAVNISESLPPREGIEFEANCFQEVFMSQDIEEGINAFIEKREPNFKHI